MLQSSGGPRNLTMLSDFYEFTMMGGYLENGLADTQAVFDVFFSRGSGWRRLCDLFGSGAGA